MFLQNIMLPLAGFKVKCPVSGTKSFDLSKPERESGNISLGWLFYV